MAIAIIISFIAFFVAMIALWLASGISRKVEALNENFVRAHIAGLREELREMDKVLVKAGRAVQKQENAQADLDTRLNDHTKVLEVLKTQITSVATHLEELDRSIPSRYRVRIAKREAEKAEKQPSKPAIQ